MSILNTKCFVGRYKVGQNCYTDLNEYIERYEPIYLKRLLGANLYELFKNDLVNGVPQEQRFIDIFEPFCKEIHCHNIISQGIKDMLTGFVYFEYSRRLNTRVRADNINASKIEQGVLSNAITAGSGIAYNEALETYRAIQYCMNDEREIYEDYNGEYLEYLFYI